MTAAVTEITDQELAALRSGGWNNNDDDDRPGWEREMETGDGRRMRQSVFPSIFTGWNAGSDSGDDLWRGTFDEALAWCDKRAGGRKPAKPGSATKQEARFVRLAAGG